MSASADAVGNNTNRIRVYRNGTLTGGAWSDIEANSSSFEKNTTNTISSGQFIDGIPLAKSGQAEVDLQMKNIILSPGESITITQESGSTSEATALISWSEFH